MLLQLPPLLCSPCLGLEDLCPSGCVAAVSEVWSPSQHSSAAFSEMLSSEFMDCSVLRCAYTCLQRLRPSPELLQYRATASL